jgi:hypothetical protein
MSHLSRTELVDFIEASPQMPAERAHHASTCNECRAEADALRSIRALAITDEVPEPSPLFWDHFPARVAAAIGEEPPGRSRGADAPAGIRWLRAPLMTWAAAATMAVLMIITVVWRTTLHAPAPVRGPEVATTSTGSGTAAPSAVTPVSDDTDVDADEAWAVVRAAAQDLRWDEAHAAGLSARPGAAEGLALELTADERSVLARLLDKELEKGKRAKG